MTIESERSAPIVRRELDALIASGSEELTRLADSGDARPWFEQARLLADQAENLVAELLELDDGDADRSW